MGDGGGVCCCCCCYCGVVVMKAMVVELEREWLELSENSRKFMQSLCRHTGWCINGRLWGAGNK